MDPLTLAALGLPQLFKLGQALKQEREAERVQLRDTTPPALREALALGRQGAVATAPGTAATLDRIQAGTNDTLQAATRAGTSGQSILGLLEASDANRTQALSTLSSQQQVYQQGQQRNLQGLLGQEAAVQTHDQQELDRNRAALREAARRNLYGALDGASQLGVYAALHQNSDDNATYGLEAGKAKAYGRKVANAAGPVVSGPDDVLAPRRPRYNSLGVPDYGTRPTTT
jgi:hypothetical protein